MEFLQSTRSGNIFYGDIFKIRNNGCLIFGHGKSMVCAKYTGEETEEIGRDMACITADEGKIYGHFEMDFRAASVPDPIHERVELGCFIRMMSEEETEYSNIHNSYQVTLEKFVELSKFNITFDLVGHTPVANQEKLMTFRGLIEGKNPRCYVIPWCKTPEERGAMVVACVLAEDNLNDGGDLK